MSIRITWYGHGMTILEYGSGPKLLIDPAYHNNPYSAMDPDLTGTAIVLLTGGGDYVPQAIEIVAPKTSDARVVGHPSLCRWVEMKTSERTEALNRGGTLVLGDLRITMVRAEHTYDMLPSTGLDPVYGEGVGYVLRHPNHPTVYVSGRTNVFGDMSLIKQLYAPEVALMSVGGRFSMGSEEAAHAVDLLGVETVFPTHRTSDHEDPDLNPLFSKMSSVGGNCYPLHPGEPFDL